MPRNKRLLPIASALGPTPRVSIPDDEWRCLGEILGKVLQPAIRKEIIEVTDRFLHFAAFELTREPIDEALNRLEALTKTGEDLLRALADAGSSGDGSVYAVHLLRHHFVAPEIRRKDKFDALTNIITSFVVACAKAREELSDRSSDHRQTDSWETWIRNLTEIMKRNNLPTAARKDAVLNKSGTPSEFVLFIKQLQRQFDERFRRGTHSTDALAVAIGRSRRVAKESAQGKYKTRKRNI
jgi:hypothetical protein